MPIDTIAPPTGLRATLATAELAAFLDMVGPAAEASLRPEGASAARDAALLAKLANAGLVQQSAPTATGRMVAEALRAPRCMLEVALWTDAQEGAMTVAFPGAPAAGSGVVVNRQADQSSLVGFVDDRASIALIEPLLATTPIETAVFEARLDLESAIVLAALLDMAIADDDRCLRARTARHVAEWLSIWWGASARTSLTGQVFALTLAPDPPTEDRVTEHLQRFADAGLATHEDFGRYRPGSDLEPSVRSLARIGAGFDMHRLDIPDDGPPRARLAHVLTGDRGCLVVELLAGPRIVIRATGRKGALACLASLLAGESEERTTHVALPQTAPPTNRPVRRFCGACGAKIDAGWRFCGACGKGLTE